MTPERAIHPATPAPLLTVREASKILRLCERTTWTLIERGDLPAIRLGRSVRIDPDDLRTALERAKVGAR